MSGLLKLGPVHIRISRKGLASWGYPRIQVGGFSMWSRTNTGDLSLVAYHPRNSTTWHWYVHLRRNRLTSRRKRWSIWQPSQRRTNQWHDYFRLPFGWEIVIGHQDYHKDQPQ